MKGKKQNIITDNERLNNELNIKIKSCNNLIKTIRIEKLKNYSKIFVTLFLGMASSIIIGKYISTINRSFGTFVETFLCGVSFFAWVYGLQESNSVEKSLILRKELIYQKAKRDALKQGFNIND